VEAAMSVEDRIVEDKIKIFVLFALDEIPEAGKLLALIVEELWPEPGKEDVWDEIKEKVEKLLNEKISDLVFNNIKDSLKGLQANSAEYTQTLSMLLRNLTSPRAISTNKHRIFGQKGTSFCCCLCSLRWRICILL
jgi:delta endotoxin, N-terminal domain